MTCWVCEQTGGPHWWAHDTIIEWRAYWAGEAGWKRKQALAQAKRDAKAMLRKKPKK